MREVEHRAVQRYVRIAARSATKKTVFANISTAPSKAVSV